MPIQPITQVIEDQVLSKVSVQYQGVSSADLTAKTNLDPFDQFNEVNTPALEGYDFSKVTPSKAADFLTKMDLQAQEALPPVATIAPDALTDAENTVCSHPAGGAGVIPRLQHSIWVGQPLDPVNGSDKMKAFASQLAINQRTNDPGKNVQGGQQCTNGGAWQVVLWTDQPRKAFGNPADPTVTNMKQWAADNDIRLVSIDEVFGDQANHMQLHTECRLEQNKAGTGRAAASDIIRLEVLNRFGGIYVDGDKPFQKQFDEIAQQAISAQIQMDGTHVGGFVSASEGGVQVQNCALCSEKGGAVVRAILNHVGTEYAKTRSDLQTGQMNMVSEGATPQRVEVITRSGPSAIKAVTKGEGLMTGDSMQTYTGTTSWTQEEPHRGYRRTSDPANMRVADKEKLDTLEALSAVADRAPDLQSLPEVAQNLNDQQQTKIADAIKGGVTSLAYTVTNENGRLDLRHLTPHLKGFSAEEKQIAIYGTLMALNSPQFDGLRTQVTSLVPPNNSEDLTSESMDILHQHFLQIQFDNLAMQRAALHGNVALLKYGAEKRVSLQSGSAQIFDTGTPPGMDPCSYYGTTPLRAAVEGGQIEAAKFILSQSHQDEFSDATLKDQLKCLERSGELGQTEMLVAISDTVAGKIQRMPDGPGRDKAREAFSVSLSQAVRNHLDTSAAEDRHLVQRVPRNATQFAYDLRPRGEAKDKAIRQLLKNEGPLHEMDGPQLRNALQTGPGALREPDIRRFFAADPSDPKTLLGGIRQAYQNGPAAKQARDDTIKTLMVESGSDLLTRLKQVPLVNDIAGSACAAAIHTAAYGGNHAALVKLAAEGHLATGASAEEKKAIATSMAASLDNLVAPGEAARQAFLVTAGTLGIENEVLNAAARANRVDLISASLNAGPRMPKVPEGQFDMEAHNAIAHAKFTDSEAGKNAYKQITAATVPSMSRAEVQDAAHKALAYSHDRLRANATGSQSRITGWQTALEALKHHPDVQGDQQLGNLLHQTQRQVVGVNSSQPSVRDRLRAQAQDDGGPDISPRQTTSRAGRLREFFKSSAPAVPTSGTGVPGKRV